MAGHIVTLTANPLLDFHSSVVVRPGLVTRSPGFAAQAGGKGINVGRVLVRLGHRVQCCGFAGGHTGSMLGDLVAAAGLEPRFTPTAARLRVGFLALGAAGAPPTSLMEDGFAVSAAEQDQLIATLEAALDGAALLVCSGSVPDAGCTGLLARAAQAAARRGVPCWLDSYGPAMSAALSSGAPIALAKPNRDEFTSTPPAHWQAVRELHITDGRGPVEVRHPTGRFRLDPPKVVELNGVGSGDCYVAALAHARVSGTMGCEEQWAYAAAAGAANAARSDVAMIGPADIAPLCGLAEITLVEAAQSDHPFGLPSEVRDG